MDAVHPGAVLVRPLTREDVPSLFALAGEQGRNVSAADYERFLALEGARGFALERDGSFLGAATALRYYEHAFLGPLLMRAGAGEGSAGFSIALLAHLIEALQRDGVHVVEAEASAAEEPLLARMGFSVLRRTAILERATPAAPSVGAQTGGAETGGAETGGETGGAETDGVATLAMERRHLLDVGSLDADAVGFGRKDHLRALLVAFAKGARVVERDGEVVGFALLRPTLRGSQLGPVVTREDEPEVARALARDAASAAGEGPVTALVPEESALVPLLVEDGFAVVGSLARMRAAARPAPSEAASAREWVLGGRMTG